MVIALGALTAWWGWGLSLPALLYGGVVAMANTGLLAWRWYRGLRDYHCDGRKHLSGFHRSFMERFFVVVIMLAAGFSIGLLEPGFQPLAVLTGFVMGQLAWGIALAALKTE